jgi:hypothetical protein
MRDVNVNLNSQDFYRFSRHLNLKNERTKLGTVARTTIKDVTERAGVSAMTVSRVLNKCPDFSVVPKKVRDNQGCPAGRLEETLSRSIRVERIGAPPTPQVGIWLPTSSRDPKGHRPHPAGKR